MLSAIALSLVHSVQVMSLVESSVIFSWEELIFFRNFFNILKEESMLKSGEEGETFVDDNTKRAE